MINLGKNLYLGESLKKPNKVIQKLIQGKKQMNIYVIAISGVTKQLEFYNSLYLQQRYYKKHAPYIIGVAGSYGEARDLVVRIVEECMQATGTCNLNEYLMRSWTEGEE